MVAPPLRGHLFGGCADYYARPDHSDAVRD
nr:MAG TPA: hypothetical protein [Herelleviridae sp.]